MNNKKVLAGKILKVSPSKVKFVGDAAEISKAITRGDMRALISAGKVVKKATNAQSRGRARKILKQKAKGRQRGRGSRKGTATSILGRKEQWMIKIRVQREFLKLLREKGVLSPKEYRGLYNKSRGGYFRSKRHIKMYMEEHSMGVKQ